MDMQTPKRVRGCNITCGGSDDFQQIREKASRKAMKCI